MESKIQELADKIYKEGVQRADQRAEAITSQAEAKREKLLAEAEERATQIVADAQHEADKLKAQTEKDIASAVENATASLQAKITDMVTAEAVNKGVEEAFKSPEALYKVVLKMSEEMFAAEGDGITITTSEADALEAYFRNHAQKALSEKIEIKEVAGKATAFELAPHSGAYKIEVSKEAFVTYFKEFFRPRMRAMLFGESTHKE